METLGRTDRIGLPDLGIDDIHAKIDTGAYTSSLHCLKAEVVNGNLEFILLDEEHPEFTGRIHTFKKYDQREVKNSFGEAELRYIIKTKVRILGHLIRAEFSLSYRGNLKYPILLGRKILRHRFIIDVTKKDISFNQKQIRNTGNSTQPQSDL